MQPMAIVLVATACFSGVTLAATPFTSLHPEAAYPNDAPPITSGVFEDMLKQVQEKLNANGFDAGPANGAVNSKTQAALAQFQISRGLPASGALDDATLAELGVERASSATPEAAGSPVAATEEAKPE